MTNLSINFDGVEISVKAVEFNGIKQFLVESSEELCGINAEYVDVNYSCHSFEWRDVVIKGNKTYGTIYVPEDTNNISFDVRKSDGIRYNLTIFDRQILIGIRDK